MCVFGPLKQLIYYECITYSGFVILDKNLHDFLVDIKHTFKFTKVVSNKIPNPERVINSTEYIYRRRNKNLLVITNNG